MLNLTTLKQLLGDPELRAQVSQLLAEKIRADTKSLETNAQLSRYLFDIARRGGSGDDAARALRLSIKEHLDFYQTLVRMTLAFNERLSAQLRELSGQDGASAQPITMNITAPLDAIVRSGFQLENNRSRPISVGFEVTPFASEDGRHLVAADIAFDPPSLELRPGQEERIELILRVANPFKTGTTYFSTLTVTGLEATQLLIRLQVEPQPEEVARGPVIEPESAPEKQPVRKTPRKARPKAKAPTAAAARVSAPRNRARAKPTS